MRKRLREHEKLPMIEKMIRWMEMALAILGSSMDHRDLDLIISLVQECQEKKGEVTMDDVFRIRQEALDRGIPREKKRAEEEKRRKRRKASENLGI